MEHEADKLILKLRAIEEQASLACSEVPAGLTADRLHHIQALARFVRMQLEDAVTT
ncbi:MAG TPA: hypothetical protein VIV54_02960 [Burkholderiales bacterium]